MDIDAFFAKLDEALTPLGQALLNDDDDALDAALRAEGIEPTTWDTYEVERWIDNEYKLHEDVHAQACWMTADELADYLLTGIDWDLLTYCKVDTDEVDWHGIAERLIEMRPVSIVRYN